MDVPSRPNLELLVHNSPWGTALEDPETLTLMEPVQRDVDSGFAEWVEGGREEAIARFGRNCAAGRLGLVKKDGCEPRLVGDSTVSNANRLCRISEKIELPGLAGVIQFMSRHRQQRWVAFSLDVKKAHKRVKVAPSEQGFSVFTAVDPQGRTHWLVYLTCHFGGAWSAYWWSRVAAGFVRLCHILLHNSHFLSMYVDDELSLFPAASATLMACVEVMLACSLGIPLSWKKMSLGTKLKWVGWLLQFDGQPCATLSEDKVLRLEAGLRAVTQRRWVRRRELESLVGLLSWYTCGARWLKPWMAMWFHMLLKPAMHFYNLDGEQLWELQRLLDADLRVTRCATLSDVQPGWRLAECGGKVVKESSDLSRCRTKHGRAWVKLLDSASAQVRPSKDEACVAAFFLQLILRRAPVHLVETPATQCVAAADAFANSTGAGIGGWWMPNDAQLAASSICWFSISLDKSSLPEWFVPKGAGLQDVISSLEALAQLVLLVLQRQDPESRIRSPNVGCLAVRQRCDNLGVVGACEKGLSMKQPLASVLQATALFCMKERLNLRVSHLAGVRNEWADTLSRGSVKDPVFWAQLDPAKRRSLDWRAVLDAGRPEALARAV